MAINTLVFNTKLTDTLDKALVQKSVTGFLTDNVLRAKFVGAKTVLIPEVNMSGLADYDRDTGFTRGAVNVANTPFTLSMDRARSFSIDAEDEDETGISELIGQVSAEFVRTKAVPEMDAYVLSKLAGLAATNEQTVTGDPATAAFKLLQDAISKVQNEAGYDEELVAFVNSTVYAGLQTSAEFVRALVASDFKKGDLKTQVKTYNGVAILPVPDSRMMSAYTFNTGTENGGVEDGGFTPTEAAKKIGLIVMPKKAASLVKKTEKTRIFNPNENQAADAYKLDYRVYYDLFVKNSMIPTVYTYTY